MACYRDSFTVLPYTDFTLLKILPDIRGGIGKFPDDYCLTASVKEDERGGQVTLLKAYFISLPRDTAL
jgi:hypothetical protein